MIKRLSGITLSFLALLTLFLTSCEKEVNDPIIPNEEELISTLIYELQDADGGDLLTFYFQDLDGDGGNEPIITADTLQANTQYFGQIRLLNEIQTPVEDIGEEVLEEGIEHQFFFISSSDSVMVSYDDSDLNGNPIGLQSTLETKGIAELTLTVILRHEPNKSATGVSDGIIDQAGGETDIQVDFPVYVAL
jgi:hypothetical protein